MIKEKKASIRNRVLFVKTTSSNDPYILKVYQAKYRSDFEQEARILRELNKGVIFIMGYPQLKSIETTNNQFEILMKAQGKNLESYFSR